MAHLERYAFAVVAVGAALLYKLLLAPVLALATTGAALLVDVSAANAATTSAVRGNVKVRTGATNSSAVVRHRPGGAEAR